MRQIPGHEQGLPRHCLAMQGLGPGRDGAAAGISGFVTFAGFILNGYQQPVPELAPYANLTWWGWTQNHIPLGGQFDWASVGLLAVVAAILIAVGVEAFARRDLGSGTARLPIGMPHFLLGLSGPLARTTSLNLGSAFWWGIGVGLLWHGLWRARLAPDRRR